MKHKFFLLLAVLLFLAGFGAVLHSPPSVLDVLTGATPKAKRAAAEAAPLKGNYIYWVNAPGPAFTLYVPDTDFPLQKYAAVLCRKLDAQNIHAQLKPVSSTMLRSRAASGKFGAVLAAENLLQGIKLPADKITVLKGEEMERDIK